MLTSRTVIDTNRIGFGYSLNQWVIGVSVDYFYDNLFISVGPLWLSLFFGRT